VLDVKVDLVGDLGALGSLNGRRAEQRGERRDQKQNREPEDEGHDVSVLWVWGERERDAEQRVVELLGDVVVGGNADNTSRGE
jgi:hypothetical protein